MTDNIKHHPPKSQKPGVAVLALVTLALPLLLGATNGTLTVAWDPNTESNLAGYYLYWGTQSGSYSLPRVTIPKASTTFKLTGLDPALTYYVAMTAFNTAGDESAFSNEASGRPSVSFCGDGVRDSNEGCDDGNTVAGDGCSPVCQVEICANGILDPGEGCDDGNSTSGDGCSSSCQLEACGNGRLDSGEQCDDGNILSGDGCSSACKLEVCGNRVVDANEQCDDGNITSGDGCSSTCKREVCGNRVVDANEQCDDGNITSGDGCSSTCKLEVCGNRVVDANEQCDDGNITSGDGCSSTCKREVCGNRVVDANEQCDDGNTTSGDGCSSTCKLEVCGNRVVDANEQCDDGNTTSGDGCSSTCKREVCGNRTVDANEQCDDGNTTSGDGCSSTCKVETTSPTITLVEDVLNGSPYLMQCVQRTIRVTGSYFRANATVSFTDPAVTVGTITFSSPTQIIVYVTPGPGSTLGAKTVRVTNTDGSFGTISGSRSVEVVKNSDFTRNDKVGAEDFNLLAMAFGSTTGSVNYNAAVDMNGDGLINGFDLDRFTLFLGQPVTSCP